MIRVNLLPVRESERAHRERQRRALFGLILALALLAMLVLYRLQDGRLTDLERQTLAVQAEIGRHNERVREVQDLDRLKAELQAKLRVIDDLRFKRIGPARVLSDLSTAVPDDLWLAELKGTHGAATITGTARDNRTIALFMRRLQGSPYFFDVDLVETTHAGPGQGGQGAVGLQPFKRFIINASIDYYGRDGKPAAGRDEAGMSAATRMPPAQPGS